MAKTRVKQDKHGLYVRGGGYLFRIDFPPSYLSYMMHTSAFEEGDEVTVRHSGGSLGTVTGEKDGLKVKETWFSHGSYINVKPFDSNLIFRPTYHFR